MKELIKFLRRVFGIGAFIALLLGGGALLAFVIAMCCGPVTGEAIAVFIKGTYFPYLIRFTAVLVLVGFVLMYLDKQPKT